MPQSGRLEAMRLDHPASNSERLIRAGRFEEALAEIEGLLAALPNSTKYLRVKHQALMGLRRFAEAADVIGRACVLQPRNSLYRKMQAIAFKDSGDDSAALPLLAALHSEDSTDLAILSALCVANFRLGHEAEAMRFGQRKLDLLVAAAPSIEPDADDGPTAGTNVVSFSLWGEAARYCEGALLNARQLLELMPGWTARFYVDSTVPHAVREELDRLDAQVIDASLGSVAPSMWRFLVHDDRSVGRYLVRDTDSRIGSREIAAVSEWLASSFGFHAMRDHPFHNDLILAGMWGGTAGRGFSMRLLIEEASRDHRYGADQHFLGSFLWPRIRNDLLTHDSYYSTPESRPFPDGARGTDADHIGMGIVL